MATVPSGYTLLEYIESYGSQYIDTGLHATSGFKIKADIEFILLTSSLIAIIGAHNDNPPFGRNVLAVDSSKYEIGQGDGVYDGGSPIQGKRIRLEMSNVYGDLYCSVDGVKQNMTASSAGTNSFSGNSLFLFWVNGGSAWFSKLRCRLYGMSIYIGGSLAAEYIPCKNPSGVVGLYDSVSGSFYGDSASGSFVAGPELIAPSAPSFASQVTAVALSWGPVECDGYRVYKNDFLVLETSEPVFFDTSVYDGQEIEYSITAYNGSLESDPVSVSVTVKEGYTALLPIVTSAFFQ